MQNIRIAKSKFLVGFFVLNFIVSMTLQPVVFNAIAGGTLTITCDNVSISGDVYTLNGSWQAIDFPGQSSQYDTAMFSPAGTSADTSSKDSPDTFNITNGPTEFSGNPHNPDMSGTWSNQVTFVSTPSSVFATLYHSQVPGAETSGDAVCSFVIATPTPTPSITPTPSTTPTPNVTPTLTPVVTPTPDITPTPTPDVTPTPTPDVTPTPTPNITPAPTPTVNPVTLLVTTSSTGDGAGTVTSSDNKINCHTGSDEGCTATYNDGDQVTLTATADSGSTFEDTWSGACTGNNPTCSLTVTSGSSANAHFSMSPTPTPAPTGCTSNCGGGTFTSFVPTPTPIVLGASITPTPTPLVLGASTTLPNTSLTFMDSLFISFFSAIAMTGMMMMLIGYEFLPAGVLKRLD